MDREYWTSKFFELVRLLLGNAWNRTGSAIALAGVGVLTGWVDKLVMAHTQLAWQETEQWVGWVLLVLGLAMLFYGARKARSANANDVALLKKLRETFTVGQLDFLATHNFRANWHDSRIRPIEDIADDWNNAQHEFVDRKLNNLLVPIKELSRKFAALENLGFNVHAGSEVRTMMSDPDRYKLSKETEERIEGLNRLARQLAKAANELERTARKRLPEA